MRQDVSAWGGDVAAVVVTHNRKSLLCRCLRNLEAQTTRPGKIFVVDNASTDGTNDALRRDGWLNRADFEYVRLNSNLGGAGGFASGVANALERGFAWVWLMDDDAEPLPNALSELVAVRGSSDAVYGSLAFDGDDTAWLTPLKEAGPKVVDRVDDVPDLAEVEALPFLGFLIHRDLIARIGLPDASLFIAADDIEYCVRAQRAGARIFIAGKSRIRHPRSDRYTVNLPGRQLYCLRLPPWKRYYDTRNRLLIAREYYGYRLFTQTIPGSLVRLIGALAYESDKGRQFWAFLAGFVDGLLGVRGNRHKWWGIAQ